MEKFYRLVANNTIAWEVEKYFILFYIRISNGNNHGEILLGLIPNNLSLILRKSYKCNITASRNRMFYFILHVFYGFSCSNNHGEILLAICS